jgi:hypothetical protein
MARAVTYEQARAELEAASAARNAASSGPLDTYLDALLRSATALAEVARWSHLGGRPRRRNGVGEWEETDSDRPTLTLMQGGRS